MCANFAILLNAVALSLAVGSWAKSSAAPYAGSTTTAAFPPANMTASPNDPNFPDGSQVGYPGPTPTGDQAEAIATAPSFSESTYTFPLVVSNTEDHKNGFDMMQSWGNLSPFKSIDAGAHGLPDSSPLIPHGCGLTQVHLLHRHGARYPTSGGYPANFGGVVQAAAAKGFSATGPLAFLNTWKYKLGAEILTPFGRQQLFNLGVGFRVRYGELLKGFSKLPVFRTTSQDRMLNSALNFAAGFFDIETFQSDYHQLIIVEADGFNNTLSPYYQCPNANNAIGSLGSLAAANWTSRYLQPTVKRLSKYVTGLELNTTTVFAMQQLCAYETVALGYSSFCDLFTEQEWKSYEYANDLNFWYGFGPGNPAVAAQGLGYVQELVARLTKTPFTEATSTTNLTLDGNNATFPLDQPIYVDASHDTVISSIIVALNFTTLAANGPLPVTHIPAKQTYYVNQIAPFASNLVGQVLSCPASDTPTHIRWILNDAVVPLTGIKGCKADKNGLCELASFISGLKKRMAEIDFAHDCFANYTAPYPDNIIDGRYPASLRNGTQA